MPINNDANRPAIRPSKVLFGLIFFTINVFPNFEPTIKANVSNNPVFKIINP